MNMFRLLQPRMVKGFAPMALAGVLVVLGLAPTAGAASVTHDVCPGQRVDVMTSTTVSCNVLANDSGTGDLTLVDVRLVWAVVGQGPGETPIDAPQLDWSPNGNVSVTFADQWPSGLSEYMSVRAARYEYTTVAEDGSRLTGWLTAAERGPEGGYNNPSLVAVTDPIARAINEDVVRPLENDVVPAGTRIVGAGGGTVLDDGESVRLNIAGDFTDRPFGYLVETPTGEQALGFMEIAEGFTKDPDSDHGPDGPEGVPDIIGGHQNPVTLPATFNVLTNDVHDQDATVTLTEVKLVESNVETNGWSPNSVSSQFQVSFEPTGEVTIDVTTPEPDAWHTARWAYTFEDSFGQTAQSSIEFAWTSPGLRLPLEAQSDELGNRIASRFVGESRWGISVPVLDNDTFGTRSFIPDIRVLGEPSFGTVRSVRADTNDAPTFGWSPPPGYEPELIYTHSDGSRSSAPVPVTWNYQLVRGDEVSEPAYVTFDVTFSESPRHTPATVIQSPQFWEGSLNEWTFDPEEEMRDRAATLPDHLALLDAADSYSWRPQPAPANLPDGYPRPIDNGDGTWTIPRPLVGMAGLWQGHHYQYAGQFVWVAADGTDLISAAIHASDVPAPEYTGPKDDARWAATGQVINDLQVRVNDPDASGFVSGGPWYEQQRRWIDGPNKATFLPAFEWLDTPELGILHDPYNGEARYTAGQHVGVETLRYRSCVNYPDPNMACRNATATINVSPHLAASPDRTSVTPGEEVAVDVLGNDVFTDTYGDGAPSPTRAVVKVDESTLPAGVTAVVLEDRTVAVTAPDVYSGQTISFDYTLKDFTGLARTAVEVEVGDAGSPEPDPTSPTATDDTLTVKDGENGSINVLGNDTWAGDSARAEFDPYEVPVGVEIEPNDDGNVTVAVARDYDGPDAFAVTYRVDDGSPARADGRDRAALVVRVIDVPMVVDPPKNPDPPVDPPKDPDPPVNPPEVKGPTANDDQVKATYSVPVTASVLINDRVTGKASVMVVSRSLPDGVTAKVDGKGGITITVPKRLAGKTFAFRYKVTDSSRKSDFARVVVKVVDIPVIVTGADRELPQTDQAAAAASFGAEQGTSAGLRWATAGLGIALLAIALVYATGARRRRTA